ncbi:reverse transcriptase domain-containing protein [Tanacetum coccineum]
MLTSINYTMWRMCMEVLLGIQGVWDVIDLGLADAKKNNIVKVKQIKKGNAKASTSKEVKKPDQAPKDKGDDIFMVHSWGRNVRTGTGMNPPPRMDISFSPLTNVNLENYLIIICAEIGGHDVPKMYVDGGSTSKILYGHCFLRLRLEVIICAEIMRKRSAQKDLEVHQTVNAVVEIVFGAESSSFHGVECGCVAGVEAVACLDDVWNLDNLLDVDPIDPATIMTQE